MDNKLFYSISEVADMFDLSPSVLRYWEKEFPDISPSKTSGGTRRYRRDDIDVIRSVYHLVKEKKMTIEGARQALKNKTTPVDKTVKLLHSLNAIKAELLALKSEFVEMEKTVS